MAKGKTNSRKRSRPATTRARATKAIEVTGDSATLLIEVEQSPRVIQVLTEDQGGETAGAAEKAVAKMQEIGAAVAEVCRSIQEQVETALEQAAPNELSLEFGVKLTGESGVPMLTKVSAEGTLIVTAKWTLKK